VKRTFVPLKFLIEGEIKKGKLTFLKNLMWGLFPLAIFSFEEELKMEISNISKTFPLPNLDKS
jgi:hypothetical protein